MINPYVGEITGFALNWAPQGWIPCQGQTLSTAEFSELFAVIGTTFGGNGQTTFGLPNLPTPALNGGVFCISAAGIFPNGGRNALPGEITMLPYNPPPGWINCNGQLLSIPQYQALYKLIDTTFGGNGTTTFAVPNIGSIPPANGAPDHLTPKAATVPPSLFSIAANGSTDEGFVGELKIFPSTVTPPVAWVPCQGQVWPISRNTALFALLGTTYGGDGKTTFGLPNIIGMPKHLQYFIAQLGTFPRK